MSKIILSYNMIVYMSSILAFMKTVLLENQSTQGLNIFFSKLEDGMTKRLH